MVVFDCVAANPKHMFASLKESDRAAVIPDTGVVSFRYTSHLPIFSTLCIELVFACP